jgi:hypothetical protein
MLLSLEKTQFRFLFFRYDTASVTLNPDSIGCLIVISVPLLGIVLLTSSRSKDSMMYHVDGQSTYLTSPVIINNVTLSITDAAVNGNNESSHQSFDVATIIQAVTSSTVKSQPWFVILRAVCYIILFVVGTVGNLLVLAVTVWRRNPKQVIYAAKQ